MPQNYQVGGAVSLNVENCHWFKSRVVYVDVGTMASDSATLSFMFLGSDMSNRQAAQMPSANDE